MNDIVEIYTSLAKRHDQIENNILKTIRPGLKPYDLCVSIEAQLGVDIAFPVGINIDHCAAHYSPMNSSETTVFTKDNVVKIDYGIQTDGYILDAAFTVAFDNKHRELLEASRKACMEGANYFKHNRPLIEITKQIQRQVPENFGVIKDLCGHQIKPYLIHGGKVVPNVIIPYKEKAFEGEIYTVEPFVSSIKNPQVYNSVDPLEHSHYMFNYHQHSFRDSKSFLQLLPELYRYQTLAFHTRWLPQKEQSYLPKLLDKHLYQSYPPIYEKNKDTKIAQFETTLVVTTDKPILFKKYESIDKYIILEGGGELPSVAEDVVSDKV
jgi:methionyl aminopeptidase